MKIVDVRATPVYVEMEAPLLWSMGVEHGTTRTITQPFVFGNGGLRAPSGTGLGVTLDRDRLAFHARRYREHGDDIEFFDPKQRPGWTPHLPLS